MSPGTIRSRSELLTYLTNRYGECSFIDQLFSKNLANFPLRIPVFYADIINWQNREDSLLKMVFGDETENFPEPYEIADPISDAEHEPVPGLIHRYPDRALLLLTTHCAVHCRFCFRREVVGKIRPVDVNQIKNYLVTHSEIKELIFSGGDPGTYPPAFLESLHQHFASVPHLDVWRFHTRVPAVDPLSLTDDWINAVAHAPAQQKVVVTHINHPREITPEFVNVMRKLQQKNVTTLSQTVLLKQVNNNSDILKELFRGLATNGVVPYYLHHLDKAYGTHHFRVSILDGQRLFSSLRGQLSGWMIPEYVVELAHGVGKFPVMWLKSVSTNKFQATTLGGKTTFYDDPVASDFEVLTASLSLPQSQQ